IYLAGAVLCNNRYSPATVFRGDRVQDQCSVTVVLDLNGEAAVASSNDSGIGDACFVQERKVVHTEFYSGDLNDRGGFGAARIAFQMKAKGANGLVPVSFAGRFATGNHGNDQQKEIGIEPDKADLHIRR